MEGNAEAIVNAQWEKLYVGLPAEDFRYLAWLAPLVDAMRRHQRISRLYPFTSHSTLVLAVNTKYPHITAGIHVDPISEGRFRVYGPSYTIITRTYRDHSWREAQHEVLGEGDVEDTVKLVADSLDPNCGPTIDGTGDDVRRMHGMYVMSEDVWALHIAALRGRVDEIAILLDAGVDINAFDYGDRTPFMSAAMSRNVDAVRFLVERGAAVDAKSADGYTALDWAREIKFNDEIIEFLTPLYRKE